MTQLRASVGVMTGSSIAQAAIFAAASVVATRLLGAHGRGVMVVGTALGSTVALLAGMGSGIHLRARLPTARGADRVRLLASFSWTTVVGSIASALIAVALSVISSRFIATELGRPAFLLGMVAVTFGYVAFSQFTEPWYAAGEFRAGSVWATVVAATGLVALLVAATVSRSATALVIGQGSGMSLAALAQAYLLRRRGLLRFDRPDRRTVVDLLRSGSPSLGLTVGLAITLKADRYILGAVVGPAAVGVYSLISTLSELPRLVPAAIGQMLMRDTAIGAGIGRARRMTAIGVACAVVAALVIAGGSWLLLGPMFGPDFARAHGVLLVLLVAEVSFAPFTVASRGMLGGGWARVGGSIGLAGGLAAVALFLFSIPVWGVWGAALSCLIAYAGMSLVAWRTYRRRLLQRPRLATVEEAPVLVTAAVSKRTDLE
ncbi:Membrane protein involved in the export of O-antigen and teichoic acid [Micromonospora humi]|uniref:Membrane protein involved in the export of O-antigen and teichoic acid n=1 Tax=Micromonospora humi TaxID=745366 RepID=A0A1C5K7U3_9ACTN|nr:Membrane protein involved in the export of O-antigen and teichoic acid [Micromonospora humi]